MDRRQFIAAGSGMAAGSAALWSAAGTPSARAKTASNFAWSWDTDIRGAYLDLTTAEGNMHAYARMQANTDMTSTKFGWGHGIVQGVVPGEGIRDLVGFQLLSTAKFVPYLGPGEVGYSKVLREIGLYTDLETGEILEEWVNPYLNETQKVVPIANDPFNHHINMYKRQAPNYGGLNKTQAPKEPYILNFSRKGDRLHLFRHINLFYPSALQPEKWPRENGHDFNQVTETFMYQIDWADMQNPDLTSVEFHGTWSRTTPWLPWMLMGPTPGHCQYNVIMGAHDDINVVDPKVLEYVERKYPKYLTAPDTWEEPSWSSLEWYAAEQTPAPLPKRDSPLPKTGAVPVYEPGPLPAWWPAAKAKLLGDG